MASHEPVGLEKVIVQEDFSYGDHELQKLTVYHHFGRETQKDDTGLYMIYIHGGAWRDPTTTDKSFLPTIRHFFSDPASKDLVQNTVTAFISISYRLSSHPAHPQDPATPINQLRDAKHPDHIQDVVSAISFVQNKYGFRSRYLLAGHSCGATLAFQTIMRTDFNIPHVPLFRNPEILVGVAGIYDIKLLRDNNAHPAYQEFIFSAFGTNEKDWKHASPASVSDLGDWWPEVKTVALFTSSRDELVDEAQLECMWSSLKQMRSKVQVEKFSGFLEMSHDEMWKEGIGLAKAIIKALDMWAGK